VLNDLEVLKEISKRLETSFNIIVYIDEHGVPDYKGKDQNSYFFLSGIIIKPKDIKTIVDEINNFKKTWFSSKEVIIHSNEITYYRKIFASLHNDDETEKLFYQYLTGLLDKLPFQIIGALFDKEYMIAKYKQPADLYEAAIQLMAERLVLNHPAFNTHKFVSVLFWLESRGKKEDRIYKRAISNLTKFGSTKTTLPDFLSDKIKRHKWFSWSNPKKDNIAGHQLADIASHYLGRYLKIEHMKTKGISLKKPKFIDWLYAVLSNKILPNGIVLMIEKKSDIRLK